MDGHSSCSIKIKVLKQVLCTISVGCGCGWCSRAEWYHFVFFAHGVMVENTPSSSHGLSSGGATSRLDPRSE